MGNSRVLYQASGASTENPVAAEYRTALGYAEILPRSTCLKVWGVRFRCSRKIPRGGPACRQGSSRRYDRVGVAGKDRTGPPELGSITESLLRQLETPALSVGPAFSCRPAWRKSVRFPRPINYTPLARAAFDEAASLVEKTGAELVLVHVAGHHGAHEGGRLSEWVREKPGSRCGVKEVMVKGAPAEEIVNAARRAARAPSGLTSEWAEAACPVLSVIQP